MRLIYPGFGTSSCHTTKHSSSSWFHSVQYIHEHGWCVEYLMTLYQYTPCLGMYLITLPGLENVDVRCCCEWFQMHYSNKLNSCQNCTNQFTILTKQNKKQKQFQPNTHQHNVTATKYEIELCHLEYWRYTMHLDNFVPFHDIYNLITSAISYPRTKTYTTQHRPRHPYWTS